MNSQSQHRYSFDVRSLACPPRGLVATTFRVSSVASSQGAAAARVREHYPAPWRVELADVSASDELCADERCAVCYPSSRNSAEL